MSGNELRAVTIERGGAHSMVIGDGLMARAFARFREDDRVLIFASGVSNSSEIDPEAFAREERLLLESRTRYPQKLFVYFGTCSANDPERRDTPYVCHKLNLEETLCASTGPWMILRLPLAIGPSQRGSTLAQYLYHKIKSGERFEIWRHATRYPIDVEDVVRIASHFIEDRSMWNRVINVALRAFPIVNYVEAMERIVGKKAAYSIADKGAHYQLSCPEVVKLAEHLNLDFSDAYLDRVLRKYFH